MARKTFTKGQAVEVRREPGYNVAWEPAIYREYAGDGPKLTAMRGHHVVDLSPDSPPRYIDSMTGMDVAEPESNPRAYIIRKLIVPSVRIRARKATP